MRRRISVVVGAITAILAVVLTVATGPASARARHGYGGSQAEQSVTSVNIGHKFRAVIHGWGGYRYLHGDTISVANYATADTEQCSYCRTAAVSFLVVEAPGATTINAVNKATAIEVATDHSYNGAIAYEWIVTKHLDWVQHALLAGYLAAVQWEAMHAYVNPARMQADEQMLANKITGLLIGQPSSSSGPSGTAATRAAAPADPPAGGAGDGVYFYSDVNVSS